MKNILFIFLFASTFAGAQTYCCRYIAVAPPPALLMDTYPAWGQYDLRKINSAYSGNDIKVRRSSDDAELDIGFLNDTCDIAAALTFVGGGNGFVSIFYNQDGSGHDLIQATHGQQLKIVSSGVALRDGINNRLAMHLDQSANQFLHVDFTNVLVGTFSAFMVFSYTASTQVNGRFISPTNGGLADFNGCIPLLGNGGNVAVYNSGFLQSNAATMSTQHLFTFLASATTIALAVDIVSGSAPSTSTFSRNIDRFDIGYGSIGGVAGAVDGLFSSLYIYFSDETANRTPIETDINSFYHTY